MIVYLDNQFYDIKCPYCGQGYEINEIDGEQYEDYEKECDTCKQAFHIVAEKQWTYYTRKE